MEGGFQWKFDRRIFESHAGGMRAIAKPYLPEVRCRFALLRSQHGLVTRDIGAAISQDVVDTVRRETGQDVGHARR